MSFPSVVWVSSATLLMSMISSVGLEGLSKKRDGHVATYGGFPLMVIGPVNEVRFHPEAVTVR